MASTYSQNLKIELMGTGDQVDSWGDTTNENLGTALEESIVGYGAVQFTNDANLTLTLANSNETQVARKFFLYVTSTVSLSTQRDLIVPTIEKTYTVHNTTTGGQAIRVKTSAGTGVVVPSGKKMVLYVNGTSVIEQLDYATSLTVGTLTIGNLLPVASGGTGASTASGARTNLGLGTIATQNANSVAITGGSITGITDLAIADGGTGASTAPDARTNLGLGTIATQNSNSVDITGGAITGITDLAIADGGTGASTAPDARTNLGLGTIATQNANSVAITGGSITGITDLAVADGGTGASTAANARTNLGAAASGANSDITSLSGLTTPLSIAQGGTGASTAANARTNLGLGTIATQSASSVAITGGSITGITDLAVADGGTGASTAADARTNLGLGTMAIQNANSVAITGGSITGGSITGITDLAVADGGTGASTAADARTNLGLGTMATQNSNSVAITGGSITGVTGINTLGDGQTWQNVTGSRTTGVAYSNTTGRTIFVAVSANVSVASTSRDSTFLVNGAAYAYHLSSNNAGTDGQAHNYFMPIPAGATYQLNISGAGSFTIIYWSELR
jgi:hypothetical protein